MNRKQHRRCLYFCLVFVFWTFAGDVSSETKEYRFQFAKAPECSEYSPYVAMCIIELQDEKGGGEGHGVARVRLELLVDHWKLKSLDDLEGKFFTGPEKSGSQALENLLTNIRRAQGYVSPTKDQFFSHLAAAFNGGKCPNLLHYERDDIHKILFPLFERKGFQGDMRPEAIWELRSYLVKGADLVSSPVKELAGNFPRSGPREYFYLIHEHKRVLKIELTDSDMRCLPCRTPDCEQW